MYSVARSDYIQNQILSRGIFIAPAHGSSQMTTIPSPFNFDLTRAARYNNSHSWRDTRVQTTNAASATCHWKNWNPWWRNGAALNARARLRKRMTPNALIRLRFNRTKKANAAADAVGAIIFCFSSKSPP